MPDWLAIISAVVGLMAGLVTFYEFFKVEYQGHWEKT